MSAPARRTLLAVSGTLQEGFELRANLDHPEAPAVFIGEGVVRGVKAYLDIKEPGCREYRPPPERPRPYWRPCKRRWASLQASQLGGALFG